MTCRLPCATRLVANSAPPAVWRRLHFPGREREGGSEPGQAEVRCPTVIVKSWYGYSTPTLTSGGSSAYAELKTALATLAAAEPRVGREAGPPAAVSTAPGSLCRDAG